MKKTLSLITTLFLLNACGGGSGGPLEYVRGGGAAVYEPFFPIPGITNPGNSSAEQSKLAGKATPYSNLPNYNAPTPADISKINQNHQDVFKNLYNSVYLNFLPHNNPASYNEKTNYGLNRNFNQGFAGNDIVIGVIDSGTNNLKASNVVINSHFTYKNQFQPGTWNDLDKRLDNNNFEEHSFSTDYVSNDEGPILHGGHVMNAANSIGSGLRFANIVIGFDQTTKSGLQDFAATIDALSNKGVRFFNRSYGPIADTNNYLENPGVYFPAIMQNNALVVSAAGNELTNGTHTANALDPNNPMRKGWIVALGYLNTEASNELNNMLEASEKQTLNNDYYIINNGVKEFVHHWGDTCKKNKGWDDCISAPFKSKEHYGTSFSTPFVTATAALIYEKYPWMSNENIKDTIFTTAYEVQSDTGKTADDIKAHFGVGVLNPNKAMNGVAEFKKDFNANVNLDNLYVFSNDISGTGGIIKDGIGTLALTGNNTFTGSSEIRKGTLWLTKGQNYKADFKNDAVLRLTNIKTTGKITNNAILINEGDNTMGDLDLRINSKIYSNLGDTINVTNTAKLDGEFNLIGINYAKNILLNQDVELLTAANITGQFANVQSISAFLDISTPNYLANKVTVQATRIDTSKIPNIDDYAAKNYQQLFTQIDDKLAHEIKNQNKQINISTNKDYGNPAYVGDNLYLSEFANFVINTPKSALSRTTRKLFGSDLYTNSIMNVARIKNIQSKHLKNHFSIEQSYNYNLIDDLKESSSETLISNAINFDDSSLAFGFTYNTANVYKDDFKNNAKTIGLLAEHSINFDDFYLNNKLSYFNIKNKYNRFDNSSSFRNNVFALSSELGYNINSFSPYVGLNAIFYHQNKFSEVGDASALDFETFKKNFYYANLGLKYKSDFNELKLLTNIDLEYNFNKDYSLNAKNKLVDSKVSVSNGFYKRILLNAGMDLGYQINNKFNLGLRYKTSLAKDYFTNQFMLGFGYIF